MSPNPTTYCWSPTDRGGDIAEGKGYRLAIVIQYDAETNLFIYCTVIPRRQGALTPYMLDSRVATLSATDTGREALEGWKEYAVDHPGANVGLFVRKEVLA